LLFSLKKAKSFMHTNPGVSKKVKNPLTHEFV
jgi:hypothetical protein